MSVFSRRTGGAVIAYAIATQGAWADLTANDVWADWKAYVGGMGYEISGDEAASGGQLKVTNITVGMQIPEEDASFSMSMPEMTLRDQGDGTVAIDFPAEFPLTFVIEAEGEDPITGVLDYAQQNMSLVASGSPDDVTYDYSADALSMRLASLEAEGEKMPEGALNVSVDMSGVSGSSKMKIADMREISQSFASDALSYSFAFDDPEGDDKGSFNGALNGVSYSGTGTIPKEFNASDYSDMLTSGFAFGGTMSFTSGNGAMEGTGDGESFAFTSKSNGGDFTVSMDAQKLLYDVKQRGAEISVSSQELPFPVDIKMAEAGFKVDVPVQPGDDPQPFGFGFTLADFTMSDMIWSMFDPAGALPRDPATIALDATGTAKILVNFLDPAVAETLEATGAAPGELNSLKVNNLLVSLVGAKLSGTGDFEFDNSNTDAFDGMPAPSGVADLQLAGANGLLDKLIAMGFVSDSDAMGARMMMGMLAVPGDQPDTLNSRIEINKQGHISANGQRIK